MDKGYLDKKHKRSIYMKIKGNNFRSKSAMLMYLIDHDMVDGSKKDEILKEYKKG